MKRILVVDDEPNVRLMLAELLRPLADVVETAASGREAVEKVDGSHFQLVLLDLKMPGMDGLDVLRRVRETRPDVRVLMLTAYGTTQTAVEAIKLGAEDFIEKPFDPQQLQDLVRRLLDRKLVPGEPLQDYAAIFGFARQCVEHHHLAAAIEHLRRAIALAPDRPEAFNLLGATYELRADHAQAHKYYLAAYHLDPSYDPAQQNLKRIGVRPRWSSQIVLGDVRKKD